MLEKLTLKNVTIISVLLIIIGFSQHFHSFYPYDEVFRYILIAGGIGFSLAYYLYAVNHWGVQNKFLAIVMLTVPLLALFFSNIKISDMANILVYIAFPVVSAIIISSVLLIIGDKIKWAVRPYVVKVKGKNYRFHFPESSYALLGILFISFLVIAITPSSVFSDNITSQNLSFNPSAQISQNISVTQNYENSVTTKSYPYILRGNISTINVSLDSGVYNELLSRSQPVTCYRNTSDTSPCNNEEVRQYFLKYLDETTQKNDLHEFVRQIKFQTADHDDQVRIAISLVQNIPYDHSKATPLFFRTGISRYPHIVLYENAGICEEKSLLLAYLLRDLGYGVVLFEFETEDHMAIGIKSPPQYSYSNSGYAFIETTTPSIPTDSLGDYGTAGKLTSPSQIYLISEGNSFTSISEEYQDVQLYNQIVNMGTVLDDYHYSQWTALEKKYGMSEDI